MAGGLVEKSIVNMENKEKVHIGLPVFNGERYLAQSLDSLLNQTYENFRLFIVDNLSKDGTQDIARAYARRDKRITYIRQTVWGSWPENWSRTWEIAAPRSRFFMWASDDDLWAPDYIEILIPPLLSDPKIVLSCSNVDVINEEGEIVNHLSRDSYLYEKTAFGRIHNLVTNTFYTAIYGLFKTSAISDSPPFPGVSFGDDLWFLIKLAAKGKFHLQKKTLFRKRKGGISETGNDPCTVKDPNLIWNIGPKEWKLINQLNVHYLTKLWTFYNLRIHAKIFLRQKKIDWFLYPLYFYTLLLKNPRSFGVRSRVRRFAKLKIGNPMGIISE